MPKKWWTFGLTREQEDRFRQANLIPDMAFARVSVFLVLLTILAFAVNDHPFLGYSWRFFGLQGLRLAMTIYTALLLRSFRRLRSYRSYDRREFVWAMTIAGFILISAAARPHGFVGHAIPVVLGLFVTALGIPNRFLNQLTVCLVMAAGETAILAADWRAAGSQALTALISVVGSGAIAVACGWLFHSWRRREFLAREAGGWTPPAWTTQWDRRLTDMDNRLWGFLAPARSLAAPAIWRYGMAMVIVVAATALRWALIPWLGTSVPYNVSLVAVVLTTLLFGLGPGLLSVFLGDIAVELFILGSWLEIFSAHTLARWGLSVAIGFFLVWLIHSIRAAQARARQSEARLNHAQQMADVGDWEWDVGTGRLTWSDQIYRQFGKRPGSFHPTYESLLESIHPEDRAGFRAFLEQSLAARAPYDTEFRIVREDGEVRVLHSRGEVERGPDDRPLRMAGVCADITERQRAEEALREKDRELAADLDAATRLHRIGMLFASESSLGPVLAEVVEAAIAISGADFGNIQLLDPVSSSLKIAAHRGFPDWWIDSWNEVSEGRGVCGTALERAERVIVEDVERSPIFVGTPALDVQLRAGVRAVQSTPLVSRSGRPLGVFSTHYKTPRRPNERALRLLDLLARQAADIIERAQSEKALRDSEDRFRVLSENVQSAVALVDEEGKFCIVNRAFLSLFDIPEDADILNVNSRDWSLWQVFDETGALLDVDEHPVRRAAVTGRPVREKLVAVKTPARGDMKWMLISADPILDGAGKVRRLICTYYDITALRGVEEALRESEMRFRSVLDRSRDVIYRLNMRTGLYEYISPACQSVVGFSPEELKAQGAETSLAMIHPDDLPGMRAALARLDATGEAEAEYRQRTKSGAYHWLSNRMSLTRDESGRPLYREGNIRDITEQRQAAESLQTTLRRFYTVLSGAHTAILLATEDGRVEFANQALCDLYEFKESPAELVGLTSQQIIDKVKSGYEDPEAAVAHIKGILERGEPVHGEEVVIRGRTVLRDFVPLWVGEEPYGRLWHHTDITERKRTEALVRALAEQERLRLGAAVEQASDSVVMVDLTGKIQYVNAAFESLNRTSRDKAVGRTYFDFLAAQSPALPAIREAVALGRAWHGPLAGTIPGRGRVELDVTVSPATDPAGKIIGGLITEKDVTRENALQEQVRQAQKMEALGTLAGGITHDFNNILGTIIINTELALLDLDPVHPARWPLPLVLQAANRGKELVKQIITFSRQRAWERKPLEIAPVVKEGLKFLRSTLPKGISIGEAIDVGSGVVLADPSHVHQILTNLCQNAALAMPGDSGRIQVRLEPVAVDAGFSARHPDLKTGDYVRLTVSDRGSGMSPEVIERIFEPFFTTREPGQGSGLGLSVVQGIVKSYDGAIIVESAPGQGSVFSVYLPRLEGEVLAAGTVSLGQPARGGEKILLVEDEKAQRESLKNGLEHLGYKVTARADGRTALAAFRKSPATFDAVITDQIMPRMSGLELAEELVKLRPDIPVVLCTGFSEKVDGGTVGQKGIRVLVMKPFTIQEITRAIRAALKK